MAKVVIFIRDNGNGPSSYYRMRQYIRDDSSSQVRLFTYSPLSLFNFYTKIPLNRKLFRKMIQAVLYVIGVFRITWFIVYDLIVYHSTTVVVIRRFFPRRMPFWGSKLLVYYLKKRTLYWDFDDNIILDKEIEPREAEILQNLATNISVTSSFLRETLNADSHHKVLLLPTTDSSFMGSNIADFISYREKMFDTEIHLVWIGTNYNLKYLKSIINNLDKAAAQCVSHLNKQLYLSVVSNEQLQCSPEYLIIKNIPWTREKANEVLQSSHIGLMPLEDNDYTRGKGGFKAIQYISAGVPAIVSHVGFNLKVVDANYNGYLVRKDDEWVEYVVELARNKGLWLNMSRNARSKWEQQFHAKYNLAYWEKIIHS